MYNTIILIILALLPAFGNAEEPSGRLFRLERSKNRNYVCYDVNLSSGKLDTSEPMTVYWIRAEEGGGRKPLSYIQRKLAFGYKVVKANADKAVVTLAAYNKLPITVCRRNGQWVAIAEISGKEIRITRLYVQLRNPNSLHVEYVQIDGLRTDNGEAVMERIVN